MTPTPVDVSVTIPFDWVTGLLVPVASILVSAGIAVWLARRERFSADEDRVATAASKVVRSLTDLANACTSADWTVVRAAQTQFEGDLNEFSVALPQADSDVPKYVYAVCDLALHTRNHEVIFQTGLFLAACLESWVRRQHSTGDFTRSMPPGADAVWLTTVRLGDWVTVTADPATDTVAGSGDSEPAADVEHRGGVEASAPDRRDP